MTFRTAALTAALLLASQAQAAQDIPGQDVSDIPARQWQPFWAKRETGYIKTADGTELRYSALLPAGQGTFPVLVRYSGYDSGSIGGSAYLWLSTPMGPDMDVQVTLTQLLPDGQEVFIQRGWLRMSARKLDEKKSTALRPWRLDTPDAVEPMLPETPTLGRVEIPPFSHPFRAGSQVRIWIDAPGRTGGYGFDTFALPARPKLLHDAQHPSSLVLGELKGVQIPQAQPACNSLLKQPCRPDPLNKANQ